MNVILHMSVKRLKAHFTKRARLVVQVATARGRHTHTHRHTQAREANEFV